MACIVLSMVVARTGVRDWSDSESISSFWSEDKPNLPLTDDIRLPF